MTTIQVCGDPTVDWMTVRKESEPELGPFFWMPDQPAPKVGLSVQPGGSALITQLLQALIPSTVSTVQGITLDAALLEKPDAPITRAWTSWQQQGNGNARSAFRLAEWSSYEPGAWDYAGNKASGVPALLVIEDSGLGFRECPAGWPEILGDDCHGTPSHIIVKLALYGGGKRSPVLEQIIKRGLAKRTTILTAIGDIRACAVCVSESLSWERLLEHVVAAVRACTCRFVDPVTSQLAFEQVIVTVGAAGAVIVNDKTATLVFDRSGQEGDFERHYKGSMMGYNTCVVGGLAAAWAANPEGMDWKQATRDGIALARLLHLGGYDADKGRLKFPSERLAQGYASRNAAPDKRVGEREKVWDLATFEDSSNLVENSRGTWTILKQAVLGGAQSNSRSELIAKVGDCARNIVRQGPAVTLRNVPIETIGAWKSADRHEIEGVRSVKNAMQEYLQKTRPDTPLAVAVFGPPGSGKSFAIKQVAKDLGIDKEAQLTFNLSQFESAEELAGAFHQIRDLHLKGKMPLVFWDEFDTPCAGVPLGWLRYFLAPIQDGQFSDKGRSHPTGGGIYVFAGGTRPSFKQFCQVLSDADRAAKKPDFVSRLRAFIDVRGPNGDPNLVEDDLYVIRRSFLLNAFLEHHGAHLKKNKQFQIGDGVLDAFLRTTKYRHGARSMESIVIMSALKGRGKFEQSSLPPEHLLSMHVDARDFVELAEMCGWEMLRIGITGHIGLDPAKMEQLDRGIEEAIEFIERTFPKRYLTVFSPLAIGADRLVARKLLERKGSRLIAVLPVPETDYLEDFGPTDSHRENYEGAEARQEFRHWLSHRAIETIVVPTSATRNEAYEKVGFYIAEYSDVMIAVWDGLPSQGRGGTADIVAKARELGKPTCHIWAGNYKKDPEKRTDVGEKHGTVEFINFTSARGLD
ncbi:MAG TPA: ATP-binding protein [Terriglobales bacterium]|jgi:hypothetical protein